MEDSLLGHGFKLTAPHSIALLNESVKELNAGNPNRALDLLYEINITVQQAGEDAHYNFVYGAILERLGKPELALQHYQRAYSRFPRLPDICKKIGILHLAAGRINEAAVFLKKHLQFLKCSDKEDTLVLGDSHAQFCFTGIPRCRVMWLGPITMHRLARDGLESVGLSAALTTHTRQVIVSSGEIDVRAHITEQANKGSSVSDVMTDLASRYVGSLELAAREHPGIRFIAASIPPPLTCQENPELPFRASVAQRAEITRGMNQLLQQLLKDKRVLFLDYGKYFADSHGLMYRYLSDEIVHVKREYSDIIEFEIDYLLTTSAGP